MPRQQGQFLHASCSTQPFCIDKVYPEDPWLLWASRACPTEHEKVCMKHKRTGPLSAELVWRTSKMPKAKGLDWDGGHVIDSWAPGHQEVLPSPSFIWHWVTGLTSEPCRTCVPIVSLHTGPLCAGHSVPLSAPHRTGCWEFLSLLSDSGTSLSPVTERNPHFGQHLYGRPTASKKLCILTDLLCQSSLWSLAQLGTVRQASQRSRD